ncbi:hypothetical protein MRX96_045390 [Rhipicephalus microplus]
MSGRGQLFIGRLPLDTRERDVEQVFERYGRLLRCDVKYGTGMAYAFVDYEDHRDAEDAVKYERPGDPGPERGGGVGSWALLSAISWKAI